MASYDTVRFTMERFEVERPDYFTSPYGSLEPTRFTQTKRAMIRYNVGKYNYHSFRLNTRIATPKNGYRPAYIAIKECLRSPIPYLLVIEVSLPKIFFGHNLYELTDADFEPCMKKLQDVLALYGVHVEIEDLINATDIQRLDYGINIPCPTDNVARFIRFLIILARTRLEPKQYEYEGDGTATTWTNSQQRLEYYNKLPEVKKELKDSHIEEKDLDFIHNAPPTLRIEQRLLASKRIKRELAHFLPHNAPYTLQEALKESVCSQIVQKHFSLSAPEWKIKSQILAEDIDEGRLKDIYDAAEGLNLKSISPYWEIHSLLTRTINEYEAERVVKGYLAPRTLARYRKKYLDALNHFEMDDWRISMLEHINANLSDTRPYQLKTISESK